jgi:multidrug efflux pump subunit AcrA (membrane-fusion protein)
MTLPKRLLAGLALVPLLLLVSAVFPQDKQPLKTSEDKTKTSKDGTVKVEKGVFKAVVSLKGVFAPAEMHELALRTEAWGGGVGGGGPLVVISAVESGTPVKKGDVLVSLQLDKIDHAIRDAESDLRLGEVAIRLAEEELPILEKSTPQELAAAERSKREADQDLDRYLKIDQPLAKESADNMLKNSKHWLEYAQEELKQLQKMYRSKDLTEETEEIILKRQRHQVEMAEFSVKTSKIHHEQTLKIDLPRREQNAKDNVEKQTLALQKARTTLQLSVDQKRLALDKLKYDHSKSAERLAQLKKDREQMTVKAPADGIVYYGKYHNGQWSSSTVAAKLVRGGMLMPEEVLLTVVSTRPLLAHASVEEKDLHWIKKGLKGVATPTGFPDLRLPVELTEVSTVPQAGGGFAAMFKVDASGDATAIVPGMSCTIKLTPYRKDTALTLPSSAVFSDDDEEHYVYRASNKEKMVVKVGKTANDKTEILDGLKEGDAVLSSKP